MVCSVDGASGGAGVGGAEAIFRSISGARSFSGALVSVADPATRREGWPALGLLDFSNTF